MGDIEFAERLIDAVQAGAIISEIVQMLADRRDANVRQQAALMAPADEIGSLIPNTVGDMCALAGITVEEFKADPTVAKLKIFADLRCRWADAVLRREQETRG